MQPSGAAQREHDKKNEVLWRLRGWRLVGCGATEEKRVKGAEKDGAGFQQKEKGAFQAKGVSVATV